MPGFMTSYEDSEEEFDQETQEDFLEEVTPVLRRKFVSIEDFKRIMEDLILEIEHLTEEEIQLDLDSAFPE